MRQAPTRSADLRLPLIIRGLLVALVTSCCCPGAARASISATPTSLGFGNVLVGETQSLNLVLFNTGPADASIFGLPVIGSSTFSASPDITFPFVIPVAETAFVTIGFSPSASSVYTGTLLIDTDGVDPTVAMSGTGVPEPIAGAFLPLGVLFLRRRSRLRGRP
jgi:hypothetical protein